MPHSQRSSARLQNYVQYKRIKAKFERMEAEGKPQSKRNTGVRSALDSELLTSTLSLLWPCWLPQGPVKTPRTLIPGLLALASSWDTCERKYMTSPSLSLRASLTGYTPCLLPVSVHLSWFVFLLNTY